MVVLTVICHFDSCVNSFIVTWTINIFQLLINSKLDNLFFDLVISKKFGQLNGTLLSSCFIHYDSLVFRLQGVNLVIGHVDIPLL